jgi:pimeloyl-ACP methyl ester carboxylesterase
LPRRDAPAWGQFGGQFAKLWTASTLSALGSGLATIAHVARDVRGVVIPASGHNIALENPAALAQAYLDFFAGD